MKPSALLWSLLTLLALSLPAGAEVWEWQNPLPAGNNLEGAAFTDSLTGWMVGGYGTVFHTTDGGVTWNTWSVPTLAHLQAVSFADVRNGWIAGWDWATQRGIILHTTNGGASWITRSLLWDPWWKKVVCVDSLSAWACGWGTILQTTNGGATWLTRFDDLYLSFYGMAVVDESNVWVAGYDGLSSEGCVLRTTNGGVNWDVLWPSGATYLWDAAFVTADTGFVISIYGNLFRTSDAGQTWSSGVPGTGGNLISVCFADSHNGWLTGTNGRVLHTTDGGESWAQTSVGTHCFLTDICFTDSTRGWACGEGSGRFRSTDGGQTWSRFGSGFDAALTGVSFMDASNGWAVGGYGTILHTSNGGQAWQQQVSGLTAWISDVAFVNTLDGWAVAYGTIIHTSDGGGSWQAQISGLNASFSTVDFADTLSGWAVTYDATIFHTSDGGAVWTPQTIPVTTELWNVDAVDSLNAWAVGYGGTWPYTGYLLRTTNGGQDWSVQSTRNNAYWLGVSFAENGHGYIVGADNQRGSGEIWQTYDNGLHWSAMQLNAPGTVLYNVKCRGETAVVVGQWGFIKRTTDGGVNWSRDTSYTDNLLEDVALADGGHAWVVGEGGAILHSLSPSAAEHLPPAVASSYELRAFPNPFNPLTNITLSLPVSGRARVDVFDVTGRLRRTLVNTALSGGTHTFVFDASDLSSGVYFARLTAGERSRTLRLHLLK